MTSTVLREFLELPYDALEEMNLATKQARLDRTPADQLREDRLKYLTDQKGIKAVTVCFTDLEGRLHMLDYDKKFLLKSLDNLTFDGSSVRGFSAQHESDLRLVIDWAAFYLLPSDIFGSGKALVFSQVMGRDGTPYSADLRARLKLFTEDLYEKQSLVCNVAPEIEGFLFKGRDAERYYFENGKFEYVSTGGYYHSLPGDALRLFIDTAAEVQRAMGFQNEKDHPEVAPSQFEMNFSYSEVLITADQVQLYKLLCRQVAAKYDMTASFLPKPVTGVNGNGMHTNMSFSKGGKNLYWDASGPEQLSETGWGAISNILQQADGLCLVLNPSVNAYRRLDPHYEAPNQIKASANDRGSMVRIPTGNERSKRIEVRSVAPDANPYMVFYSVMRAALEGKGGAMSVAQAREGARTLPDNIYTAIDDFRSSEFMADILGEDVLAKFADLKEASANRCPRALGSQIKVPEIQFHHEVTNQWLWNQF
ncbi:MAG: glutamine synthetase [Myxococcales bacterium]|nr:glutamine synthetase [Myxococcales bacterium]MCB9733621.1 glutamine synthetase [Deltaproteobacteria bacterium]